MIGLRTVPAAPAAPLHTPSARWTKLVTTGGSVAFLALGCLFFSTLIAQLGLFPTLFAAVVVAYGIAAQLVELSSSDVQL